MRRLVRLRLVRGDVDRGDLVENYVVDALEYILILSIECIGISGRFRVSTRLEW